MISPPPVGGGGSVNGAGGHVFCRNMSIACMTRRPYGTALLLVNGIGAPSSGSAGSADPSRQSRPAPTLAQRVGVERSNFLAIRQIPRRTPRFQPAAFESRARAICGSIAAALWRRAAKGGRILNDNKRPDIVPAGQGVCLDDQSARPRTPRLNAAARHTAATSQTSAQAPTCATMGGSHATE